MGLLFDEVNTPFWVADAPVQLSDTLVWWKPRPIKCFGFGPLFSYDWGGKGHTCFLTLISEFKS